MNKLRQQDKDRREAQQQQRFVHLLELMDKRNC